MAAPVDSHHRTSSSPPWTRLLLLMLLLAYAPYILSQDFWTHSYIKGDSYYYRAAIISIIEDGDLLVANNVAYDPLNGQLAVGRDGLVPKHPILLSLLGLPFYALFGSYGLLIFNLLLTLALMGMLLQLNRLYLSPIVAWGTTLLYGVATLFHNYVYNFSPDVLSTLLVLAGTYFLFRQRVAYSGALLGLAVFAKPVNLLPVALLSLYLLWTQVQVSRSESGGHSLTIGWRRLLLYAACLGLSLLPHLAINHILFGSPLVTGYQRIAVPGPSPESVAVATHVYDFNQPIITNLYPVLFAPNKGLLTTNLLIILGVPGLVSLARSPRRRELVLLAGISVATLLLITKYDFWYLSHFSNRFLMLVVVFSAPFTGWTMEQVSQKYDWRL
jgi:hypothetical protein